MIDYIVNWDWDPRFIKASKIAIDKDREKKTFLFLSFFIKNK